ncbi:uncharacterized protein LOC125523438 [Triticum urartu]|uniref:DUF4408 domain-containing protein n=1 Tax=Triticum urartu TaxID=4572 RepID=A0A8R7V8B3_TRIUA|nr:uncharacterized protein LOC125523438 [Triticum urartu]
MLEAAIPALWSTVHGWFTPWVLFLVLNIVIGTIAVTSKASPPAGGGEGAAAAAGGERRSLSRVPSMALDRLRSFNMSRFTAPAPEAPVSGVLDLGSDEQLPPLEMEPEAQGELEHEHVHMERSMSEAAAEAELPRLPARLRKSASDSRRSHTSWPRRTPRWWRRAGRRRRGTGSAAAAPWRRSRRSRCRRRRSRRPAARWTRARTTSSTSSATS